MAIFHGAIAVQSYARIGASEAENMHGAQKESLIFCGGARLLVWSCGLYAVVEVTISRRTVVHKHLLFFYGHHESALNASFLFARTMEGQKEEFDDVPDLAFNRE